MNIEPDIRSRLLNYFETNDQLLMRSINRDVIERNPEEIIIKVEVATIGKQGSLLENLVASLTMELEVTRAGWKLVSHETDF